MILDQLPRKISLLDATLIVVGVVIGSGIFLLPSVIARSVPSATAIMAIWIVTGLVSLLGAFAYAELGAMMPATGGQYVFLREAYGPACAFLSAWVFVFAAVPGGIAFLSRGFSIYLAQFIPLSPVAGNMVAAGLIIVLSAINYIGVREGTWTQRIFGSLKILGLILLIGAAVFSSPGGPVTAPAPQAFSYHGIGVAVAACLLAYNGWSFVSFVAGEVTHPERNIPRSLVLGMALVIFLYMGANLAYMHVLSLPEIAVSERVGATVMQRITGPAGARLLSVLILCSIVGAINGNILTGARIPFAQARDGLFFARFGHIHSRFQTPSFAIAVQCGWSRVLLLSGSFEALYRVHHSFGLALLHTYVGAVGCCAANFPMRSDRTGCGVILRHFGSSSRLLYGLSPTPLVDQPKPSLAAILIAGAGIPFYIVRTRTMRRLPKAAMLPPENRSNASLRSRCRTPAGPESAASPQHRDASLPPRFIDKWRARSNTPQDRYRRKPRPSAGPKRAPPRCSIHAE